MNVLTRITSAGFSAVTGNRFAWNDSGDDGILCGVELPHRSRAFRQQTLFNSGNATVLVFASDRMTTAVSHSNDASGRADTEPRAPAGPRLVVSNDNTDAILVRAALDGERAAFQTLVKRHLPRVRATARRLLDSDADADDVAQESFIRLWNRLGDIEVGGAGVWPWVRRVTFNLCMDRRRGQREIVPDVLETLPSGDDQQRDLEQADLAQRVLAAFAELPERQSAAIALFHYEGFTVKEIAETMDATADAIESLLGRARRALKLALKDDWKALLPSTSFASDEAEGK